jgi:putative ABC transport system permease protein
MRWLSALDKKLLRDLWHIWPQVLAVAFVLAAGVATYLLAVGAYRSLDVTRSAYYDRNRFADVFVLLTRAPKSIEDNLAAIPGVATVETRVMKSALLDVEGLAEPATGFAISVPDNEPAKLNLLYMRQGRLPDPGNASEVTVNEAFAIANHFGIGSHFKANLNGSKRDLTIVGLALSPEFIHVIGPGEIMPDPRRLAVMWMSQKALSALFGLQGAFNSVSIKLLHGARETDVIERADAILNRYGGSGAYGRKNQISHEFIDAELEQLKAMSRIAPPVFLLVSAFLINTILSRLIVLEREQIGLFKAIGYGDDAIAWHYLKLVLVIAAIGISIGSLFGTWYGAYITRMYARIYQFPFLIFRRDAELYLIAAGIGLAAAIAGGLRGAMQALALAPAVAMQPPVPARFQRGRIEAFRLFAILTPMTVMALRSMLRIPFRAAMTGLGIALSTAILVSSLFWLDSVEFMIDVYFFQSEREQASIDFAGLRPFAAMQAIERLPGVLRAEPYRSVSAKLVNGPRSRIVALVGKPQDRELSRVLALDLRPVSIPRQGLVVSRRLAEILDLRRGDAVDIQLLEGRRGTQRAVVSDVIEQFFGLGAYMDLDFLNTLLSDPPLVSGANVAYDTAAEPALFEAIKAAPATAGIGLQRLSLKRFRETIRENIIIMTSVYIGLAVVIGFGVTYNAARVQLSERGRELATLRVLGFTQGEAWRIIVTELVFLAVLSQPLGWVLGYGLGWLIMQGFVSDLYFIPMIISRATYAEATLVAFASTLVSILIIRRRIGTLDLIEVLKTRE